MQNISFSVPGVEKLEFYHLKLEYFYYAMDSLMININVSKNIFYSSRMLNHMNYLLLELWNTLHSRWYHILQICFFLGGGGGGGGGEYL